MTVCNKRSTEFVAEFKRISKKFPSFLPVAKTFTQALKRQVCFVHLAQVGMT